MAIMAKAAEKALPVLVEAAPAIAEMAGAAGSKALSKVRLRVLETARNVHSAAGARTSAFRARFDGAYNSTKKSRLINLGYAGGSWVAGVAASHIWSENVKSAHKGIVETAAKTDSAACERLRQAALKAGVPQALIPSRLCLEHQAQYVLPVLMVALPHFKALRPIIGEFGPAMMATGLDLMKGNVNKGVDAVSTVVGRIIMDLIKERCERMEKNGTLKDCFDITTGL